jgi:hypothetical protein
VEWWWFLRLPFNQKLLIKKQVQTGVSIYRRGVFPSSPIRSVLPRQRRPSLHARSSPSAVLTFIASTLVPASNRGMLFMFRAIILLAIVCFHSVVGIALDHDRKIVQYQHTAWRSQDGVVRGTTMTQTTDGYASRHCWDVAMRPLDWNID